MKQKKNFAAGRIIVATRKVNGTECYVWEKLSLSSDIASEANSSIAFMGVVTTVLALFVGFGFSALPPVINATLTAGLVTCLAALLAYANSTGAVARFGGINAVRHMEIGNILSEFGGIKLLLLIAPAALALQSTHILLSLLVSSVVSILLVLTHNEKMNITMRYFKKRTETLHIAADILFAVAGVFAAQNPATLNIWAATVILYLTTLGAICSTRNETQPQDN
jgi:hypothetical protein